MDLSDDKINGYRIKFISPNQKYVIRKYLGTGASYIMSGLAYLLRPFIPSSSFILDRPIFIIGCSRSGTTLFLNIFQEHEDLANWSEASQVFEPAYYRPDIEHYKSSNHATAFHKGRIYLLFALFMRLKRKTRFLNKHPQNSLRLEFIKSIYPDARFVHIIRDGRATAYSHCSQITRDAYRQRIPFGLFPKPIQWQLYMNLPLIDQFAHQWVDIISYIRETIEKCGWSQDYIEIKYEDFCRNPHKKIKEVDRFVGLDSGRRFENIPKFFKVRNDKWKKALSENDLARLEIITNPLLQKLGYISNISYN